MRLMNVFICATIALLWLGCSDTSGSNESTGSDTSEESETTGAESGDSDVATESGEDAPETGGETGKETGEDASAETGAEETGTDASEETEAEETGTDATEETGDDPDATTETGEEDTETGDEEDVTDPPEDVVDPDVTEPLVDVGEPPEDTSTAVSCLTSADCTALELCDLNTCNDPGTCVDHPGECPTNLAPECGCDGATYNNACERLLAGVGLEHPGICQNSIAPGSPCTTGLSDCGPGSFCKVNGCGDGLTGACLPKPTGCTIGNGACGCDGNTYGSECGVHEAGVNHAGPGACPSTSLNCTVAGAVFGAGEGCDPGEYCMGGCVGEGFCKSKQGNNCSGTLMDVVCSCNDQSYGNDCTMAAAGMNKAHDGWCEGDTGFPEYCDAFGNDDPCSEGKKCNIQSCEADGTGTCLQVEPMCISFGPQECGCDDVTYFNVCARVKAEVGKAYDGPCTEDGLPATCTLGAPAGECGQGMACAGPIGQCSGEGTCKTIDFVCCLLGGGPDVCGCNGQSYGCACAAQKAGVAIQGYLPTSGECP